VPVAVQDHVRARGPLRFDECSQRARGGQREEQIRLRKRPLRALQHERPARPPAREQRHGEKGRIPLLGELRKILELLGDARIVDRDRPHRLHRGAGDALPHLQANLAQHLAIESIVPAQQLLREMGGFANFALSFSIISVLTGAVTLYGHGLHYGGPLQMSLGWPLVTLLTLPIALSLAELASAYPTAGALYHWSSILGGRGPGFLTAWLNTIRQFAIP